MQASRSASGPTTRPPSPPPSALQLETWRLLWDELLRDAPALAECRAWETRRQRARPQMLELLRRYLAGGIATSDLRTTFDLRTRTDWDVFGLRGAAGAMFLNQLVKHAPEPVVSACLREALPVPPDADEGRRRLRAVITTLEQLAHAGRVSTRLLQPTRAVFFLTLWWHLQDTERWPSFQPSARALLRREQELYAPSGDPVEDYFAFRDAFLTLAEALGLSAWELEYLCWWSKRRGEPEEPLGAGEAGRPPVRRRAPDRPARLAIVREPAWEGAPATGPAPGPPGESDRTSVDHTQVQWLLATVGRRLGCRVWIAANDQSRRWNGESLGALSIRRFPSLGLDPHSQRIVSLIDVVWLRGAHQVAAAFEIEHTSSIHSGLLRMADLAALAPNLSFPLYLVAPRERLDKVRRELLRPTFQALRLQRRCAFFASEALLDAADSIMRWANDPTAIERLAVRVGDAPPDELPTA